MEQQFANFSWWRKCLPASIPTTATGGTAITMHLSVLVWSSRGLSKAVSAVTNGHQTWIIYSSKSRLKNRWSNQRRLNSRFKQIDLFLWSLISIPDHASISLLIVSFESLIAADSSSSRVCFLQSRHWVSLPGLLSSLSVRIVVTWNHLFILPSEGNLS